MITNNESQIIAKLSKDILAWFSTKVGIDDLSITEIQVDFSSNIDTDGNIYNKNSYIILTIENCTISVTIPFELNAECKVIFNEISNDMITDASDVIHFYPATKSKVIHINSNSTCIIAFSKSLNRCIVGNFITDNYFVLNNIDSNTPISDLQIYVIEITKDNM